MIFGFTFHYFDDIKPRIHAISKRVILHFITALNSVLNNLIASLEKVQKYVGNYFSSSLIISGASPLQSPSLPMAGVSGMRQVTECIFNQRFSLF